MSKKQREIVTLCGSTRFYDTFRAVNLQETVRGYAVYSIGYDANSDGHLFAHLTPAELAEIKVDLDDLHFWKIEQATAGIIVLNVGDYIGDSTRNEVAHARALGKRIRWYDWPSQWALASEELYE